MKSKSIPLFIILLILSLGCSPSLVSAYDYKQPVKLSKEEYQKRLQNYIDTPDELKIYVDDIVHPEEEVDYITMYEVSKNINIPKRDPAKKPEQPSIPKNSNAVLYEVNEKLTGYDVDNPQGAAGSFFEAYGNDYFAYLPIMDLAETAVKIKAIATTQVEIYDDMVHTGMMGVNPYETLELSPGRTMTYSDFFQRLSESKPTFDGFLVAEPRGRYPAFTIGVAQAADIINENFYQIKSYQALSILNGKLNEQGFPNFKTPTAQYIQDHHQLDLLVSKKDPVVGYARDHTSAAEYLASAEQRPSNWGRAPREISPWKIIQTYLDMGIPIEQASNIFKEKYTEQVRSTVNTFEGGIMLVVAIVFLVLGFVYK
jgi:hypothetical protein